MIFTSKHAGYIFGIRDPLWNMNVPQGMPPMQIRPALVADFGAAGGVALMGDEFQDDEGWAHADIRGGVFDSDEAAERLGWTEEEKKIVEDKMLRAVNDPNFADFSLFTPPVPVAPWPTYDDTHHNRVVTLAKELGMVREALAYESQTKNRDSVIAQLNEALEQQHVEESLTAA